MKYHIAFKFLAIFLCALALLVSVASAVGVIWVADAGLYTNTVQQLQQQRKESHLEVLANAIATDYAAGALSNCPETLIRIYTERYYIPSHLETSQQWYYTVKDQNGQLLDSRMEGLDTAQAERYEFLTQAEYPTVLGWSTQSDGYNDSLWEDASSNAPTEVTAPVPGIGEVRGDTDYRYVEHLGYEEDSIEYVFTLGICEAPPYLVTLYLLPGAYELEASQEWAFLETAHTHRFDLLYLLCAGLVIFAITAVYLCCAAGRKPKCTQVSPGGLNRLPLDVYLATAAGGSFGLLMLCAEIGYSLYDTQYLWLLCIAFGLCGFAASLLSVGFCFACAAQLKTGGGYWWRSSLICRVLTTLFRALRWLWRSIRRGCRWLLRRIDRFITLLPLTWQWLLTALGMAILLLLGAIFLWESVLVMLFALVICLIIVLYGIHAFGTLMDSARRMSEGDLHIKVPENNLIGCFKSFAGYLNALADVTQEAAKKQMKSERMKAELVTNVSHDIKTPLTSIINYVDLLQKAQSQEEAGQYLEVLDRQSQRLKKLIEDLMEMSKASTGNMAVELQSVDAAEAINQALGEFSDKLAVAQLTPIFTPPAQSVHMIADGRLTWRVLSNLLSNAVKYALPGTRLYVDLITLDSQVLISLKNISAEPLNVSSEDPMERFVRGDASRNTDVSGLGLNIAKNLMELQRGQLQLLVDGDLFKATLIFPQA